MASPNHWVVLDDTDTTQIQYSDGWVAVAPDRDINGLGNFGVPFRNSLHAIKQDGSLTFKFNGSSIDVYGTTRITRGAAGDDPSYECIVDNVSIKINPPLLFPENNWSLCNTENLSTDKEHTLEVRVKVTNNTFYFDRLQYAPSNEADFNATTLALYAARHPSVTFDSGWKSARDIGNGTNTNGAKAKISFVGKSLSWFGLVPGPDPPITQTSGTYAIDGGTPTSFLLRGLAPGSMDQYNQMFFQTPQLSQGSHTVEVTYGGDSTTTPLILIHYIVEDEVIAPTPSDVPSPGGGGGGGGGGNGGNSKNDQDSKGAPIGAIVGAIVGVFAVIALVAGIVLFLRRRRKSQEGASLFRNGTIDAHMVEYDDHPGNVLSPSSALYPTADHTVPRPYTDMTHGNTSPPALLPVRKNASPYRALETADSSSAALMSSTASSSASHLSPGVTSPSAYTVTNQTPSQSLYSMAVSKSQLTPVRRPAGPTSGASSSNKQVAAMGAVTRLEYTEGDDRDTSAPREQQAVMLRHEDSGLRLNSQPSQGQRVVELPPNYTPS